MSKSLQQLENGEKIFADENLEYESSDDEANLKSYIIEGHHEKLVSIKPWLNGLTLQLDAQSLFPTNYECECYTVQMGVEMGGEQVEMEQEVTEFRIEIFKSLKTIFIETDQELLSEKLNFMIEILACENWLNLTLIEKHY